MDDLFSYLKASKEIALIKSCVFHYEMEFIHCAFLYLIIQYADQDPKEGKFDYGLALSTTPFLSYLSEVTNCLPFF